MIIAPEINRIILQVQFISLKSKFFKLNKINFSGNNRYQNNDIAKYL